MKRYFSKNIVFICCFFATLYSGINAQSANGSLEKTIKQRNVLNQITDEDNSTESVRKYYEAILETDSTSYEVLTNLGVIYQQNGNLEKSLLYFNKAAEYHPQKARAYHNLGILNSIIGNLDGAVVNLNKAAELDLNNPNSIRQLGIIYLQNEKYEEAIESFNDALGRDNLDTESYLGKSIVYWSLKDYDNVLNVISEMQQLDLRFNRMELLLADVFFKKKEYEKAMKYAKIDETENSSQPEGHYLLGVLYEINGDKEKAEFEFDKANSITKQNPQASLELSIDIFFESSINEQRK